MPSTTSFNLAFADWMHNDIERFDRLWLPPEFSSSNVKLCLRRFSPHAIAYLDRSGVNVAIEWNYDTWGHIYARDLQAERTNAGEWRCGLDLEPICNHLSIGQLWIEKLFVPLVDWLEGTLASAEVVCLFEQRQHRRAALVSRTSPLPAFARYAVVADLPDSG